MNLSFISNYILYLSLIFRNYLRTAPNRDVDVDVHVLLASGERRHDLEPTKFVIIRILHRFDWLKQDCGRRMWLQMTIWICRWWQTLFLSKNVNLKP